MAVDAAGNAYVTGEFWESTTYGTFDLTGAGGWDAVVAKYAPGGELLWARSGGGSGPDRGIGITVDEAGNAYVVGLFDGTATFGTFTLEGSESDDIFLAKYSPEGEVLWAVHAGGGFYVTCQALAVDAGSNLYVAGQFGVGQNNTTATFGPFTLTSAGGSDAFLVKYAPDGEVMWAEGGHGLSNDEAHGVAVDANGYVLVTGRFFRTVTFGDHTLTSAGRSDVFLVSYTPNGEVAAARRNGGPYDDDGYGVAVDAEGNVYVAGEFAFETTFGPFTLEGFGAVDVFLVKYASDGAVQWAQGGGSPDFDHLGGIAVDAGGRGIYITGSFGAFGGGSATFGPFTLTSAGDEDTFLVRYAPEGDVSWGESGGGADWDAGTDVAVGASGETYFTGYFNLFGDGPATFGPVTLLSAGDADVFVAELSAPTVATEPDGAPGEKFVLSEARPNPTVSTAHLALAVDKPQHVRAAVYDALGRRVAVLHDGPLAAGVEHTLVFEGASLPPGLYVVRVAGERFSATRRLTLVQ